MCVEKTRAYVKNNKKKLVNAVVGWGRPVYTGEENAPLLNKLAATPAKSTSPDAAKKSSTSQNIKKSSSSGKGNQVK
jgi:hypothetical protein